MICPSCGSHGAYVGLFANNVECDREGCEKYVAPMSALVDALLPGAIDAMDSLAKSALERWAEPCGIAAVTLQVDALIRRGQLRLDERADAIRLLSEGHAIAVDPIDTHPNPGATDPAGNSSTTGPS